MLLTNFKFRAFKSLLKKELEISEKCIGFVGINESGKSNVLEAIRVLGGERTLRNSDTPKMAKENEPFITYVFKLLPDEFSEIQSICKSIFQQCIPEFNNDILSCDIVHFNIKYDKHDNKEYRYFEFPNSKIEENLWILNDNKSVKKYQIKTKSGFKEIDDCLILANDDYVLHIEFEQKLIEIGDLKELLFQKESLLKELSNTNKVDEEEPSELPDDNTLGDSNEEQTDDNVQTEAQLSNDILLLKTKIQAIQNEIEGYTTPDYIKSLNKKIVELTATIKTETANNQALSEQLKPLKSTAAPTTAQTTQIDTLEAQIKKVNTTITSSRNKIEEIKNTIRLLEEKIADKYTNDKTVFIEYIMAEIEGRLIDLLPKVIYWEYDEAYLQKSVVNLDDIINKDKLTDIPRPLLNIFRIALGIKNMDELKTKIKDVRDDPPELSRISNQLTSGANQFLHDIWEDYNQKIQITMEQDRLRFEIFDPDSNGASYYALTERSQGCRTFISFLLTIGIEAKKGVLENAILLLDEPETHLHPSGVKYMLKELIKISERNLVFYATHSMFMIDRGNFARHVIITKSKEKTEFAYALSNRIGNFMQEEVLYNALQIELDEFVPWAKVNFVFEGYGDTVFFQCFYNRLEKKEPPFNINGCMFHHGGGCKQIENFLKHHNKRIAVKTKWIFVLDSDQSGNNLKEYIKNQFGDQQDFFVVQYEKDGVTNVELEDLLPDNIKLSVYNSILKQEGQNEIDENVYAGLLKDKNSFYCQFELLCEKYSLDKSKTKEVFKEKLNETLALFVKEVNEKNDNTLEFDVYNTWFKKTIEAVMAQKKK
jgi:predicted ATP-dependent endonuclease of OLD family